jgi:hypothetical protein
MAPGAKASCSNDGQRRTLEQIGRGYGISQERIRHIETKTMTKLCHVDGSPRALLIALRLPRLAGQESSWPLAIGEE